MTIPERCVDVLRLGSCLFAGVMLCAGCHRPTEGSPAEVRLVPIAEYGKSESIFGAPLAQIDSFLVSPQGDVLVLDGRLNEILAFEEDGALDWRGGQEGQGPGELAGVGGMAMVAGEVLLLNQSGSRLDRWTIDGNYRGSTPIALPRMTRLVGAVSPSKIVLASPLWGSVGVTLHYMELRAGELRPMVAVAVAIRPPSTLPARLALDVDVLTAGSRVLVGSNTDFQLREYDASGELVWRYMRQDSRLQGFSYQEAQGSRTLYPGGRISAPLPIMGDMFLVALAWAQNDGPIDSMGELRSATRFTAVELLDRNGEVLWAETRRSKDQVERGVPIAADASGRYVYLQKEIPYPHIAKYEIDIRWRDEAATRNQ